MENESTKRKENDELIEEIMNKRIDRQLYRIALEDNTENI